MQELWATATVHHHSIRFKMDNKKHIVNLESFREMLHICPRLPHQPFVEPPFEEEILAFLRFLGHSGAIRRLTDVNINKLHQPWRSFVAIINKCLTGKSSGYDILRLSQAQILWGLYHKRNVDFAYLMWEDFAYQVEHKDTKKSNEMYYPRFTKVIIHHFMSKDPSIPRRNNMNWHYVRDDHMNSNAYKEYYAVATGATPPKPKASVWKTRSSFDTTITPRTAVACPRLTTSEKGKQEAKASKAKSLSALSKNSTDEEGDDDEGKDGDGDDGEEGNDDDDDQEHDGDDDEDDEEKGNDDKQAFDEEEFIHPSLSTHAEEESRDEKSFEPIPKTPKNGDDEGNGKENLGTNVGREEGIMKRKRKMNYTKTSILIKEGSLSVSSQFVTSMLNPTPDAGMKSIFETTSQMDVQTLISVALLPMSASTLTPSTIATITTTQQEPLPPTTAPKQTVNEQLEAEVLTRSSNSWKTSYAIVVDLFEMELKKILIEKIEGNKSIQQSNEQRNLYKALVEAYESDKIILDTYRDTVTLKRRRNDDADIDEEPSVGSGRGSKRRREGKEPESASAPTEKATRSAGKSTHPECETGADDQPILHIQPWISELVKQSDSRSSFNELMDTPVDLSAFLMNRLRVDTLTLELLVGPTYELMKGSCKSLESARDVYSKRRIIAVTELKIVEWHNYKHLYWITVQRDDDKLYKFKEGDFKRLRIQDIEDMLLLLVQGKLTNLTVKERDGTLTDVRTALDDRLKGICMKYLPHSIWRKSDEDRAAAMIQAIDKRLKTRRIIRSLERNEMEYQKDRPCIEIYEDIRWLGIEHLSDTYVFTMKMEILLELTSNKLMVGQSLRIYRKLKDRGEGTWFQLSHAFITTCSYPTIKCKDIMKAQVHVSRLPLL
nr:hypothetical protein [Tanacetum cinerariifolium]